MATSRQELITKLAKRKAGIDYNCDECGEYIRKGSQYFRVETTRTSKGITERGVKVFCSHHKIKMRCQID